MINMGEIFAHERIGSIAMDRVPMSQREIEQFSVQAGDLLFARQSLVAAGAGKCSVIKAVGETTTFESHLIRVRLDRSQCDPYFYFYYFLSPQGKANVQSLVMQVAAAGIRGSELAKLHVPLPPLPIQRRIAGILSAYDDLIENSQRRIKILESMARALYREWFVHFRFPGHESVPRVTSPLGETPKGWEVKRLPECIHINPRVTVPREGEKPFVPMGCLSNDSMLISDIEVRAGNSGAKFQNGDTLVARITPCLENGKTGFVQFLPDANAVAFGSTEFIVLRSRTLTVEFVYCLARSDEFRGVAIKSMSGATGRQRVQEQCFADLQVAQPPSTLLDRFSGIVAPSFRLIYELHLQVQNLRRTRDLLLPRLLSGQIDVEAMDHA
ncbi:restriction endonuclease subunit S [Accumulibacter sp.]|nr:restriction endonuclease subunit S [Accumulibacter sp.]